MRSRELIKLLNRLPESKQVAVHWVMAQARDWGWNDTQGEKLGLELGKLLKLRRLYDYARDPLVLQVHFGQPLGLLKEACEAACVYPLGDSLCLYLYVYRDRHILRIPVFGEGQCDKEENSWKAAGSPPVSASLLQTGGGEQLEIGYLRSSDIDFTYLRTCLSATHDQDEELILRTVGYF